MKKRRLLALVLTLALLTAALVGCGGNASTSSPTKTPAQTAAPSGGGKADVPQTADKKVSLRFSTFHESTDRNGSSSTM